MSTLKALASVASRAVDRLFPDKTEARRQQVELNRAELAGAPPSRLRLWRSFLMWVLSLCFAWEVVARPILLTYWPDLRLPPSMLDEVETLLLGAMGLGF
jgi:hypothetical protein